MFFGPLILEHADVDKQSDFVEKLIPSEMIDSDVIAFIAEHIDRLKDCVITDEFKEKAICRVLSPSASSLINDK